MADMSKPTVWAQTSCVESGRGMGGFALPTLGGFLAGAGRPRLLERGLPIRVGGAPDLEGRELERPEDKDAPVGLVLINLVDRRDDLGNRGPDRDQLLRGPHEAVGFAAVARARGEFGEEIDAHGIAVEEQSLLLGRQLPP